MYYDPPSKSKVIKAIMFGTVSGILLCTCLVSISAAAVVQMKALPTDYINVISIFFCVLSAFLASFIAVRMCKCKGLLYGAVTSAVLFFILLAAGLSVNISPISLISFTKLAAMVITGMIAGIAAVNKKEKVR